MSTSAARFRQLHPAATRLASIAALLFVLLTAVGCELLGHNSNHDADLAVNRRIWDAGNTGNYTFSLLRGCFCVYGGPFDITVLDNQIVDVSRPLPYEPATVPAEDYQYFQTIDDLFDILASAYRTGADDVSVDYSDRGNPSLISIDYLKNAVDDEVSYTVSELQFYTPDH